MFCQCCQGRVYWLSEKEILSIGCQDLLEQAYQAIELTADGVHLSKEDENQFIFDIEEECAAAYPRLEKAGHSATEQDFSI